MQEEFDISRLSRETESITEYEKQLQRLKRDGNKTNFIEDTVESALENLEDSNPHPFIIYGEPQSGKTEMMICLTAKLIDKGHKIIIPLLNDSVDLLKQNLGRFQESGMAPTPRNFSEILDRVHDLEGSSHVLFCKKNARDLEKLIDRIDRLGRVVIIDDEADYASPNAQINNNDKSKINELIDRLKGVNGIYIGVTATPARLDLNNTFGNKSANWVEFGTHENYTGHEDFFPIDKAPSYSLKLLPDDGDFPKYPREAFFRYLAASAFINHKSHVATNYSMLIHTSVRVLEHQSDRQLIQETINVLADANSPLHETYAESLWKQIKLRYPECDSYGLLNYIINNISRNQLVVLNSKRDVTTNGMDASNPKALFTVVFGGNVVSRGVTLNNLISMYFTRNVKHKIQQDVYIQRARMFGVRGHYLEHFELTIPKGLYADWHRCFVYHKLSLDGARQGNAPIWNIDKRVSAVAPSSIDKAHVSQTNSGVTSFELFDFTDAMKSRLQSVIGNMSLIGMSELDDIRTILGVESVPDYLIRFINRMETDRAKVGWYVSTKIGGTERPENGDDFSKVYRRKGFWESKAERLEDRANHHFKIFFNDEGKARVFHKYICSDISGLRFLKNEGTG